MSWCKSTSWWWSNVLTSFIQVHHCKWIVCKNWSRQRLHASFVDLFHTLILLYQPNWLPVCWWLFLQDEDSLCNKLCTFTVTQKEFMNQHWYHCHTCKMNDGVGVCTVCAKVCHKDHDITYAKYGSFFCDCGAKEDGSCVVSAPQCSCLGCNQIQRMFFSFNLASFLLKLVLLVAGPSQTNSQQWGRWSKCCSTIAICHWWNGWRKRWHRRFVNWKRVISDHWDELFSSTCRNWTWRLNWCCNQWKWTSGIRSSNFQISQSLI